MRHHVTSVRNAENDGAAAIHYAVHSSAGVQLGRSPGTPPRRLRPKPSFTGTDNRFSNTPEGYLVAHRIQMRLGKNTAQIWEMFRSWDPECSDEAYWRASEDWAYWESQLLNSQRNFRRHSMSVSQPGRRIRLKRERARQLLGDKRFRQARDESREIWEFVPELDCWARIEYDRATRRYHAVEDRTLRDQNQSRSSRKQATTGRTR